MRNKVKIALEWLTEILDSQQVQYQIVGGLAATIHGGSRPVADIDLYIHQADADKLLKQVGPCVSKPLKHYVEGAWDLHYVQLIYQSQKIEIGLFPGTKIRSSHDGSWHELRIDFSSSTLKRFYDIELSVMPLDELISYKRILGREVDLIDIAQLSAK
ncbi:MazG-related protein [Vibrio sp. ZSDZ34]|uniref:MazG-related protein n=1 Tax=Vibrio gelatinilyticus TaxID=2893468 RepID=A0A9X1W8S9_9VIBR|nr:MazG-related protein [Vibrio gelatinilyticus]